METQNQENQNHNSESVAGFIWDLVKIIAISLVIIIPFRLIIAEPFVVSGSSMLPNFHNRDYLIVNRITYKSHLPSRGDVIVMKYPKDNRQYFIKRVIGLPGESVSLENGKVKISNTNNPAGFILEENYLPKDTPTLGKPGPTTLGSEEYFVLGDNRTASSDSRVWGILPKTDIVGKAWFRVFPFKAFGFIESAKYW